MYLYIDETETDNYFIVVGLLMPSQEITDQTFRIFKNSIKNYYIPHKQKAKLFNEFKSTLTKNKYRYIRRRMVEALIIDCSQIFCCKKAKRTQTIKQGEKEKYYLRLIDCMMRLLRNDELHVRFDSFGINRFDSIVISKISNYKNVISVMGVNSQMNHGIQFADNICGIVRNAPNNLNLSIINNKLIYVLDEK